MVRVSELSSLSALSTQAKARSEQVSKMSEEETRL